MTISVIVPTRNRCNLLSKFLQSLINQNLDNSQYEIIIIDNGSTDNTLSVAQQFMPLIPNLKYIYESTPGLHSGRHRGFFESQGDILVYADDDIEAFPTWLETIQKCFDNNSNVAMVGGKNLPKFEKNPPEWLQKFWEPNLSGQRILSYLSILDLGNKSKIISPYYVFGCNFAIRREVLKEAGGFHPDGMPQNLIKYRGDGESSVSHYVQSKGYKALYHPNASAYHWVSTSRMTVEYFCIRAYNQGISDSYTHIRRNNAAMLSSKHPLVSYKIIHSCKSLYNRTRGRFTREFANQLIRRILPSVHNKIYPEMRDIKVQIEKAYQAGFEFHKEEVDKDPNLLGWVLREDYWDYQLPLDS